MKTTGRVFLLVAAIILSFPAYSSSTNSDEQCEGTPAREPLTTGPFITDTAVPQDLGSGTLYLPLYLRFSNTIFDSHGHTRDAGQRSYSLVFPLQVFYGIAERTEMYMIIPYRRNWVEDAANPGPGGERNASYSGIGDSNVSFKYEFVKENQASPALSGLFGINIPTGRHRDLNPALLGMDSIGSGSFSFILGLNGYKYADPFKFYGNIWYSMSTTAIQDTERIYPRDRTIFNLAAEYLVTDRWVLLGEFVSRWDNYRLIGKAPNVPRQSLFSIVPGIEFIATKTMNISVGMKIDIAGKNTNRDHTPIIAVFYYF